MSKTWKWILGTILVLVIIFAIMCSIAFHAGFMRNGGIAQGMLQHHAWNGYAQHGPMMGDGFGHGAMMRGYGIAKHPFGFGFNFLRGLFPLTLLGLLVYGAYRFGKNKSDAQVNTKTSASEVPLETLQESSAAKPAESHNCRKCAGRVQDDWRNCPFCGTKQ